MFQEKPKQQKLVIKELQKAHEGRYTCIVSNTWGEIQHTFTLESREHNVYAPKIIEKPVDQTVVVGMNAHLKCVVDSGSLVPLIHWVKIKGKGDCQKGDCQQISEYKNKEELVLRNVSKKNQGTYACVMVTNGGRTMQRAYINVLEDYEEI